MSPLSYATDGLWLASVRECSCHLLSAVIRSAANKPVCLSLIPPQCSATHYQNAWQHRRLPNASPANPRLNSNLINCTSCTWRLEPDNSVTTVTAFEAVWKAICLQFQIAAKIFSRPQYFNRLGVPVCLPSLGNRALSPGIKRLGVFE